MCLTQPFRCSAFSVAANSQNRTSWSRSIPSLVANITAMPKNPSRCKYVSYSTRQRLSKLVKKILTRFAVAKKPARSERTQYRSPRIYLPTKLTDDSSFPFKEGDLLSVKVDGRKVMIQRVRRGIDQRNGAGEPSKK